MRNKNIKDQLDNNNSTSLYYYTFYNISQTINQEIFSMIKFFIQQFIWVG